MMKKLAVAMSLLLLATVALPEREAFALPPGGTDEVQVSGEASLTSRLGQETIHLAGSATITRSDPYNDGGYQQVDLEVTALALNGDSVTGPVTIGLWPSTPTTGTLRADQPGTEWPATPLIDLYLQIEAPASPSPTITLHNNNPIPVRTMYQGSPLSISSWVPTAAPWEAELPTCVTLIPQLPKDVCVTALSFTLTAETAQGVGGIAELPGAVGGGSGSSATPWLLIAGGVLAAGVAVAWPLRRVLSS